MYDFFSTKSTKNNKKFCFFRTFVDNAAFLL
nr:MAG TPA: hypothetical protein [Caudoviricetes sp.]